MALSSDLMVVLFRQSHLIFKTFNSFNYSNPHFFLKDFILQWHHWIKNFYFLQLKTSLELNCSTKDTSFIIYQ